MTTSLYAFPSLPGSGRRAQVALTIANPLAGVDRLLHGSDLRGWGAVPYADPVLYRVTGFDSSARRFQYAVNPRFGRSDPGATAYRSPLRITLDVRLDLGRPVAAQFLEQGLRVRPSRPGTRASAEVIKQRYMQRGYTDLYGTLLSLADSLALSRDQMQQMERERAVLLRHADSIYTELAGYLAALPDNFDQKAVLQRIADAEATAWRAIYAEKEFLRELLTPGQLRLLPTSIYNMITVPNFTQRFFFG